MPASTVNLDALIPRQDFEAGDDISKPGEFEKIQIHQLVRKQLLFSVLRKPDFQRETSIWSPEKVFELIVAFVEEDLVPAVILWRSPSNHIFVIDGAHRLSSLIAWANDDYGTGAISHDFFQGDDPLEHRKKTAEKTRSLIEEKYGKYRDIADAYDNPSATPKQKELGNKIVNCGIRVQWLVNADAKKAENSFFKINEQGVPLDNTEITLLYSRACPNAVAARAINQFGTGHPHWRKFEEEKRKAIQAKARIIHDQLFTPPLQGNLIQSAALPIAGRSGMASTLSLLLDTINLTNSVATGTIKSRQDAEKLIAPDIDGEKTIQYLSATSSILSRIVGKEPCSLGLHPLVYFYSDNGRHLPTSFLAVIKLMSEMDSNNSFKEFTTVRKDFESFLMDHKDFVAQISRNSRGQMKAVNKITEFLQFLYSSLREYKEPTEIEAELLSSKEFPYLKIQPEPMLGTQPKDFSTQVKNRGIIDHELQKAAVCGICESRIPVGGISHDHKIDKKFDGPSHLGNLQFTHYYCNSAKDQLIPYIAQFKEKKLEKKQILMGQ